MERVRVSRTLGGVVASATLAAAIVIGVVSCSPDDAFVASMDRFVNETVGPEYLEYVDGDPALDDVGRSARHFNVESARKAIAAAKEE